MTNPSTPQGYSPMPWSYPQLDYIYDADKEPLFEGHKATEADMFLAAAAPQLLSACEAALGYLDSDYDGEDAIPNLLTKLHSAIDAARGK